MPLDLVWVFFWLPSYATVHDFGHYSDAIDNVAIADLLKRLARLVNYVALLAFLVDVPYVTNNDDHYIDEHMNAKDEAKGEANVLELIRLRNEAR